MKKIIVPLLFLLAAFNVQSQTSDEALKLKISGYVKNDFFYDSRQVTAGREGSLLFFPAPPKFDNAMDINAKSSINMLAIQSRLTFKADGTEAFGAKASAMLEGDFFGQANDNINLLRLRYAYVKLKWTNTEFLAGQYDIPMFIAECFPGTVSFNTGLPFQPGVRNPQMRLTQTIGSFRVVGIASMQRDYASRGPAGATGDYLRNAAMPELTAHIYYNTKIGENELFAGLGAGYKELLPELKTALGSVTDSRVKSKSFAGFFKLTTRPVTFKIYGLYGENMADVLCLGGFGVTNTDIATGELSYSPIAARNFWTEIHTNGKKIQAGLLVGYAENIGSKEKIIGSIYGFSTDIKNMYRVSPRIIINSGKVRVAAETEFTSAFYGTDKTEYAVPTNLMKVANLRLLLGVYYFF